MNTIVLAIALGSLARPVVVGAPTAFGSAHDPVTPESRVWITGSSNIRRFSCQAKRLDGAIDLRANVTRRAMLSGENFSNAPSLRIPIAQLDCGLSAMNRHLRETLRADAFDAIEFHLDSYDVHLGSRATARIAGRLCIAGTERAIVVVARIDADTSGALHVRGSHVVRMTDFGLQPPRRFGGLLRVRDAVVVHFDIVPPHNGSTATAER